MRLCTRQSPSRRSPGGQPLTRRVVAAATVVLVGIVSQPGCGGGEEGRRAVHPTSKVPVVRAHRHAFVSHRKASAPHPVVGAGAIGAGSPEWTSVAWVHGRAIAWLARRSAAGAPVELMRFDQRFVHLALHAGSLDPGGSGWRYGDTVGGRERLRLVAAFNGAFRLSTGAGGFLSEQRLGAPLLPGKASVVTYADGRTDIGSWGVEVPTRSRRVASVRQNLQLLVDHRRMSPTAQGCGASCWGATLGGGPDVARSAIGITSSGELVWAGGPSLSVVALAKALTGARVARAAELDINPEWVAGYLYRHEPSGHVLGAATVMPGQVGVPGSFLSPYTRDFFTVLAR